MYPRNMQRMLNNDSFLCWKRSLFLCGPYWTYPRINREVCFVICMFVFLHCWYLDIPRSRATVTAVENCVIFTFAGIFNLFVEKWYAFVDKAFPFSSPGVKEVFVRTFWGLTRYLRWVKKHFICRMYISSHRRKCFFFHREFILFSKD